MPSLVSVVSYVSAEYNNNSWSLYYSVVKLSPLPLSTDVPKCGEGSWRCRDPSMTADCQTHFTEPDLKESNDSRSRRSKIQCYGMC
jgi:hypothetical protein